MAVQEKTFATERDGKQAERSAAAAAGRASLTDPPESTGESAGRAPVGSP